MKRFAAALWCATMAVALAAGGDMSQAVGPLADGIPQVAVVRLRALLAQDLPAGERSAVREKLVEALLEADNPKEALALLDDPASKPPDGSEFFRAQALASLGRWSEALPAYQHAAEDAASALRSDAIMGEAEAQRALGHGEEALRTLAQLYRDARWRVRARMRSIDLMVDRGDKAGAARLLENTTAKSATEKKEKRYLRARLEAASGHREKAIELFGTILQKPEGAPYPVLIGSLMALADAHLALNTPEAGDDSLENFIDHYGTSSGLAPVFAKLNELYAAERKPSRRELSRWANDPAQPRRALAQWYLARADLRAGRREDSLRIFGQLRESHPPLPALAEGYLQFAQLFADDGKFSEATAILEEAAALPAPPEVRERLAHVTGEIRYRAGRWDEAAAHFESEAKRFPALASDALYNAAAARLQMRDSLRFVADSDELTAHGADESTRGDLNLEQGLVQAAQDDPGATASLQKFLRDFPKHPRASEALVSLAELAFHAAPPHISDAQKFLARAAESQPTPIALERADYLRIWLADAVPDPDSPNVIRLANEFLQKYPNSDFTADVRMKLAEASYRRHDFANAQTQFELLAQQTPNGVFTDKALFFAAESALQSMSANSLERALTLLDDVVKRGGELKWPARNEQAMTERKLGKTGDALTLYEEVLKGESKPGEKREAICGKADIFYDAAVADSQKYQTALELYQQLANEPGVPLHWRNQALFKAGTCLEKLEERPRALETFYRVIEDEARPDHAHEYFWFYKAGFNAARLLEEDAKWESAAKIYEKLGSAGGDRSEEAKARLARLRLEHFLWDR